MRKHLFILIALAFLSYTTAKETITYNDKEYDIRIDNLQGQPTDKYIIDKGNKITLRELYDKIKLEKENKYGKFDLILAEKFNNLKDDTLYDVNISVEYDQDPSGDTKNKANIMKESIDKMEKQRDVGLEKIKRELKIDEKDIQQRNIKVKSKNKISIRLSKNEITNLKYEKFIASIEVPSILPESEKKINYIDLQTSVYHTGINLNGLYCKAFWDLGYTGQNVNVGVNEMNKLSVTDSTALLRDMPLTVCYEGDARDNSENFHPVYVISCIENHYNSGTYGGAPGLSGLYYHAGEDMELGTDWLIDRGCKVISNSWAEPAWVENGQYWANRYSRYYDIESSSNHYVSFVVAGGNSGDGALNDTCANYNPDDRWTSTTCQECYGWNGHNTIVVGAFEDVGRYRASWSCYRNDPTHDDEVPHVMACGTYLRFPNGNLYSGTSFAAPQIAALIACMISYNPSIGAYPEIVRAALMAAADRNPVVGESKFYLDGGNDLYGGAGLPTGGRLKPILDHLCWGDLTISGCGDGSIGGCRPLSFASDEGHGCHKTFKLICNNVCSGDLAIYLSWVSNPEGTLNIGDRQPCDDLDLVVTGGGQSAASITSQNSTEAVHINHTTYPGVVEYTIDVGLYARFTNKTIYAALAVQRSDP